MTIQGKEEALTELHKDVLGGMEDDLLKVLSHQNLDGGFVPVFRDVLTHEVGLGEEKYLNIKITFRYDIHVLPSLTSPPLTLSLPSANSLQKPMMLSAVMA